MYNLPKKHINGRVFFAVPGSQLLTPEKYFGYIDMVRALIESINFQKSTLGFYINYIRDENTPNAALRFNYYTTDAKTTIESIENFASSNLDKISIFKREPADISRPKEEYNDGENEDELRFRNFLNVNTHIALDVLKDFGAMPFQVSVHCYRHYWLGAKVMPETIFGPIFEKHSNYFRELIKLSLDKNYWRDLVFLHRDKNYGLHFLVNMMTFPDPPYDARYWQKDWLTNVT